MTISKANQVFNTPPRPAKAQLIMAQQMYARHKDRFLHQQMTKNYLQASYAPVSLRWIYKTNAKAATSTVLSFLFALEFGVPFTTGLTSPKDLNPDTAVHQLREAHVFRSILAHRGIKDIETDLAERFTFTVVRDPAQRALSAFHYLCESHDQASEKFLRDRLRLSAVTAFDWTKHARTLDGFGRFLEFVKIETETEGVVPVNPHWRPQWRNVQPDILHPDLIGKTEDLPGFFAKLCAHLDCALPESSPKETRNRQNITDRVTFLDDPHCAKLIGDIYAGDYELFDYPAR